MSQLGDGVGGSQQSGWEINICEDCHRESWSETG